MKALVIIAGIILFLVGDFLLAWFLGCLVCFCRRSEKEVNDHDHDA